MCVCVHTHTHTHTHIYIYQSLSLSPFLCLYLSLSVSLYLQLSPLHSLTLPLFVCLSLYPCICLSVSPSFFPSNSVSLCLCFLSEIVSHLRPILQNFFAVIFTFVSYTKLLVTVGLYHKHITIVNDASRVIGEWCHHLEHHCRVVNYDPRDVIYTHSWCWKLRHHLWRLPLDYCNMFIVQTKASTFIQFRNLWERLGPIQVLYL